LTTIYIFAYLYSHNQTITVMKTIAKLIYLFFIWLDRKTGNYEGYSGETAPYCGHAYDGHKGYFTQSHFHESDGGGETKGCFDRYILGVWYSNVDGQEYGFSFPLYNWLRFAYYQIKAFFKYSCVKIEYPHGKRTLYVNLIHFTPYRYYRRGGFPKRVSTLHIFRLKGFVPVSHSTLSL
jgi:hypothetical protein